MPLARLALVSVAAVASVSVGLPGSPVIGTTARPIPIGRYASIGSGWVMKVVSVRPNVSPTAAGYRREPAGTGTFVVKVSLKFLGHGTGNVFRVLGRMETVGSRNLHYADAYACLGGWEPTHGWVEVRSGEATEGEVCFQDRASDALTMRLSVLPAWHEHGAPRWFAVR